MRTLYILSFFIIPLIIFSQDQIIAHRGVSSICPENTLSAFAKAIELNTGYIELDIRLSKDDSIMVIHDETLEKNHKRIRKSKG